MMDADKRPGVMVTAEDWHKVMFMLSEIHRQLQRTGHGKTFSNPIPSPYITAKEFMSAVHICRSHFDKLVREGKLMTLKKGRKIYVVASEVERYFM